MIKTQGQKEFHLGISHMWLHGLSFNTVNAVGNLRYLNNIYHCPGESMRKVLINSPVIPGVGHSRVQPRCRKSANAPDAHANSDVCVGWRYLTRCSQATIFQHQLTNAIVAFITLLNSFIVVTSHIPTLPLSGVDVFHHLPRIKLTTSTLFAPRSASIIYTTIFGQHYYHSLLRPHFDRPNEHWSHWSP